MTKLSIKTMPKTREQCEEIKDERRQSIIKTCVVLFSYHEYKSISVDVITKAVNCSHGLFYHYFNSKEHVFDATLQYAISTIDNLVYKNDETSLNAKERLSNIVKSVVSILKSKDDDVVSALYLLLNLHLKCDSFLHTRLANADIKRPLFHLVLDLIESGQKTNLLDKKYPAKEYAVALMSIIKGLAYNRIHLGHDKFTCPESDILLKIIY